MKFHFFFPFLLMLGVLFVLPSCKASKKSVESANTYSCPMHPDVMGKKGAHCPKCHMALVENASENMGCCPMHQECRGGMGTKCPKCSMPMDKPVLPYTCPMHPDQKGRKGEHCPKCHMDLEPQKPEKGNG